MNYVIATYFFFHSKSNFKINYTFRVFPPFYYNSSTCRSAHVTAFWGHQTWRKKSRWKIELIEVNSCRSLCLNCLFSLVSNSNDKWTNRRGSSGFAALRVNSARRTTTKRKTAAPSSRRAPNSQARLDECTRRELFFEKRHSSGSYPVPHMAPVSTNPFRRSPLFRSPSAAGRGDVF